MTNPDLRKSIAELAKMDIDLEKKGGPSKLRFSGEGRKIKCGKKYFKAIGVSYRQITDKEESWYLDESE